MASKKYVMTSNILTTKRHDVKKNAMKSKIRNDVKKYENNCSNPKSNDVKKYGKYVMS